MATFPGQVEGRSARDRAQSALAGMDWWLLISALAVSGFGVYVVKVATDGDIASDPGYFFNRQVAYMAIGLVAMFFVLRLDLEWLSRYVWTLYAVLIAAVGIVLVLGTSARGSTRWRRWRCRCCTCCPRWG